MRTRRTTMGGLLGNRRGQSLVIMAISLGMLLGMMALAIDLGMLYKTRAEAQRAADAAALAGASVFDDNSVTADRFIDSANVRARRLAAANYMAGAAINSAEPPTGETTVQVNVPLQRVDVWIRRPAVGTWFARILGITSTPIGAKAAARVFNSGAAKCVKPFALPDWWDERQTDADNDDYMDNDLVQGGGNNRSNETWEFDPSAGDVYQIATPNANNGVDGTGWGSDFRNNMPDLGRDASGNPVGNPPVYRTRDAGRKIAIKHSDPQAAPVPGNFLPWAIPGGTGGSWYRQNIAQCNPAEVVLGGQYNTEPGNMIGPTQQGMNDLIDQDRNARWTETDVNQNGRIDPGEGRVTNSVAGDNWQDSPRVVVVPLADPNTLGNGRNLLTFNNYALFFIEEQSNRHNAVFARFIGPVSGSGTGPVNGPLVKTLRLVE